MKPDDSGRNDLSSEPTSDVSEASMTRREFGLLGGAVVSTPASLFSSPFSSGSFTPLASEFVSAMQFGSFASFSHEIVKYSGVPSWPLSVSDDGMPSLRNWVEASDDRQLIRAHEPSGTATVAASVEDIAGRYFDSGLADTSYVDWVDLNVRVSNVELPSLPGDEEAHPDFNVLQEVFMSSEPAPINGLAFDAQENPLLGGRETIDDTNVEATGSGQTIGVIDTGLNTDDGTVFGSGPRGSPVRVPIAHNAITGEDAEVGYGRVQSAHDTESEFSNATTLAGVSVQGVNDDAYIAFTPSDSRTVSTQSEFQNGTLTDVVATSSDDLELATDGSGNYLASGTYLSEWFNFQRDTTFLSATINETLNAETTTWEYRSSPDGTSTNASAWNTDITAIPDDQYLQVRVTLNSSDGTSTPVVHDYTVDVELLSGEYVSPTHTLEDVDQAIVDLNLTDASADVRVDAYDADTSSWTTINSASTSSGGELLLDTDPSLEYNEWRIGVVFTESASGFVAELQRDLVETPEGIDNDISDWSPVSDGNGHGTWVAAAAAASPMNTDYEGVASEADLLPIKALSDDGSGATATIASAVRYGVDHGADLLCMSLGSPFYSEDLASAIQYATDQGVLVVVAAGNDRMLTRFVNYPGADSNTLAVSATTTGSPEEVKSAHFANVGPSPGTTDFSSGDTTGSEVGIAAPGMALEASLPTGKSTLSGTSMAAPFVAGAGAVVLSANPELEGDAKALRERLESTAEPAEKLAAAEATHGLLDVKAAVDGTKPEKEQEEVMTTQAQARDAGYRGESAARGGTVAKIFFGDS